MAVMISTCKKDTRIAEVLVATVINSYRDGFLAGSSLRCSQGPSSAGRVAYVGEGGLPLHAPIYLHIVKVAHCSRSDWIAAIVAIQVY